MVGKFEGQKWYDKYDILLGDITLPLFDEEIFHGKFLQDL